MDEDEAAGDGVAAGGDDAALDADAYSDGAGGDGGGDEGEPVRRALAPLGLAHLAPQLVREGIGVGMLELLDDELLERQLGVAEASERARLLAGFRLRLRRQSLRGRGRR